ncbi:MAG: hypothetical protein PVG14_15140 [Anaerolineales bacterium]|jgi:hypothetical protein
MNGIQIGRLLRASTSEFVVGCHVSQMEAPALGALVRAPLGDGYQVYGLIHDIHIEDDGLVRQLVTSEGVDEAVIADNRMNRNVPVEISVLTLGYRQGERVRHLLPPRPPLSLDVIHLCDLAELRDFTAKGRFGYFRHILRARDLPVGELLAAHFEQAQEAHASTGDHEWSQRATKELITLLRDDYQTLMSVLSTIAEVSV